MTATLEARDADPPAAPPQPPAPPPPSRPARVPASLQPWRDPHPRWAWLSLALITVVTVLTRFWALGSPPGKNVVPKNGLNFDEAYYPVEAQELLRYGYEDNRGYLFIVHPPLGKWLIAGSEYLWDGSSSEYLTNSLGWRLASAVAGTLGVIMLSRIIRRVMHSTLFGTIGGLLMAMEGMSLVLARTGILDIFLQTFIIAAFGALVLDRDRMRARLAGMLADGADLSAGVPSLGPRPWRLVAGVMVGAACGVKWTGAWFFAAFWLLSIVWDRAALRAAGVRRPTRSWVVRSTVPSVGALGLVPIGTYLLCWLGWFTGENSYGRHWADTHSSPWYVAWLPGPVRSLVHYHHLAYEFHVGLSSPHPYQSNPWSWLILGRPVDFYYNGADKTCGSTQCSREILLLGTPLLWWAFVPMLLWLAWHWFTTRDWRAGAVWMAFVAGWVVWLKDLKRTSFLFYMAPLVPFLILGLTLALGTMVGPSLRGVAAGDRYLRAERRRAWGLAGVCTFLGLVVADFVWMWPLFTGGLLTYSEWHAHMWLPSWV